MNNKSSQTDSQLLATMRDLVKVQQANQAVKEKELAIEQERIKSNEKVALASIQAQKEDRLAQMSTISKFELAKYVIIGIAIVGTILLIAVGMYTNNTQFIIEFSKMIVPLLVGLFSGYGIGRYKAHSEQNKKADDE
ncbi:hypothetical protein N8E86_09915 [Avibacterium paragallinarum]|uniref:hypothetical protein n=1 Tax=Avibacterium paragallinarum TaxID=728 RepID=UPI0021F6A55E|nr:hypothetical protein [Avibacterium paragallinarum]UXN34356.1 hypothetical protein N8E86_09915 [Avibacterium paragallinarum]